MALTLFEDTFLLPDSTDYSMPSNLASYFTNEEDFPNGTPSYMTIENFVPTVLTREKRWMDASTEEKELALFSASSQLNYSGWTGTTLLEDQTMSWPREEIEYSDAAYGRDITVPGGAMPGRVKQAIELLALFVLVSDFDAISKYAIFNTGGGPFTIRIGDIQYSDETVSNFISSISTLLSPLRDRNARTVIRSTN